MNKVWWIDPETKKAAEKLEDLGAALPPSTVAHVWERSIKVVEASELEAANAEIKRLNDKYDLQLLVKRHEQTLALLSEADKLIMDDNYLGVGVEISDFIRWKRKLKASGVLGG